VASEYVDYSRDIFPFIEKPSRYLGNEVNVIRKDLSRVKNLVALAFPDTYEVGMSHNGIRILYHLLNERDDIAAERVFMPWEDFEDKLKELGAPLASLESRKPVREFHILGVSLLYELSASNVVRLLDLARIPRRSAHRSRNDTLVVAGGPVVFNIEPMAPFFDAVALGDGEEIFLEIVDVHEKWRSSGETRLALLERLGDIPGIYVPSHFEPEYGGKGQLLKIKQVSGAKKRVLSRLLEDLNNSPHPTKPIVPYTQIVHDRVTLEVQRGCTRGCRFCHAGMVYRPVRDRDPSDVMALAEESLLNTGYEELSLSSLCIADYQPFKGLVPRMMERLAPINTSISLPSLRVGAMDPELLAEIARVRRTGFTLVPEAGSERLRNVINKVLTEADLKRNLQDILDAGWPGVKFYFMLGLPTESFEDLRQLVNMLQECAKMQRRKTGEKFRFINVSLSTFVPKPHTPFQWFPQDRKEVIKEKLNFIHEHVHDRRIHLRWSDPKNSYFEAILSKGDRRLASVIETAVDLGCKFDGWHEFFDFEKWMEAFESNDLDPEWYAYRNMSVTEPLPWDHLDCGVSKDYLSTEWNRSLREITVGDCRYESCGQCGILDNYKGVKYHYEKALPLVENRAPGIDYGAGHEPVELTIMKSQKSNSKPQGRIRQKSRRGVRQSIGPVPIGFDDASGDNPAIAAAQPDVPVSRFRFIFEKSGDMRFLSHLEVLRTFSRAIQRAGLRVAHTRGFNPHPKIVFSPPIPVGVESRMELVDIPLLEISGEPRILEVFRKIQGGLPKGLRPWAAWRLGPGFISAANSVATATYEINLPGEFSRSDLKEEIENSIDRAMAANAIEIKRIRKGKTIYFDARPTISELWAKTIMPRSGGDSGLRLYLTLRDKEGTKPKVFDILTACLGLSRKDCLRAQIRKIRIQRKAGKIREMENVV
jgi:radical SAM family uncharacterized protein/radical SAM-linked protein